MTEALTQQALIQQAQEILRTNDRGGYTVPTARLYPYQWNWDSAFVALGFATSTEPAPGGSWNCSSLVNGRTA